MELAVVIYVLSVEISVSRVEILVFAVMNSAFNELITALRTDTLLYILLSNEFEFASILEFTRDMLCKIYNSKFEEFAIKLLLIALILRSSRCICVSITEMLYYIVNNSAETELCIYVIASITLMQTEPFSKYPTEQTH